MAGLSRLRSLVFDPAHLRSLCRRLLVVLALASLNANAAAAEPSRSFDVPAGEAAETLKLAARQGGLEIAFFTETVLDVRTPELRGNFAPREALERLVAGTDLVVDDGGIAGTFTIRRREAAPPAPEGGVSSSSQPAPRMKTRNSLAAFGAWFALALTPAATAADASALPTGSIEGRVYNAAVGSYVNNARVVVEGMRLETLTNEFGDYSFPRVPVGPANVRVSFTGFTPEVVAVRVEAGQRVEANISLRGSKESDTVLLDAFTVAAKRDMAASDIAVNEQRFATEIKNVVSTDSFADIADGNVGEFAKYLPGVTLNRNGSDGINLSLGGVPPSGTPIMLDGMGIASAASSNTDRTVEFENIAVGSMSRVEVTRSPAPDSPANAIGGSVNLVSRSAFERSRPSYVFKTYFSWRGGDFSVKKEPGPFQHREYPFEPNLELSAVVPVTRNFGVTFSGLVSRTRNNGPGITQDWVPTVAAPSANFPATPADAPYLARFRLQERPKITLRNTASAGFDWRLSPQDVVTIGFQYSYFTSEFWVRQLNFDVGRVTSFGPDHTQGAPGTGFTQIITDAREKTGTSWGPSLRWRHTGRVWQLSLNGSWSRASNHYGTENYFQNNNAFFRNLTLRFVRPTEDHPTDIVATDAAGQPVNVYGLDNYRLESVGGLLYSSSAIVRTLNANAKRDFELRMPLSVKAGMDLRVEHRDMRRPGYSMNYVGADGVARTADDSVGRWFDPNYSSQSLLFGKKMEWFDLDQVGADFAQNPQRFTNNEAVAVTTYRGLVNTSQAITETITAPYLRLDSRLLNGRLLLTGGVRYERTEDVGDGPLIDPTRIYQRDAQGRIVRDAQNRPVVTAALASLAGTQLAYVERGAHVDRHYDGFFPSVSASFNLRQNLIARVSFGRSINRPNFGNILPSMNLPDTESTSRTITLTNPALKPWMADSLGVAVEYYFNEPSTGVLSARAYQRDISDFFGTSLTPATDDLLEPYGIDPAIYGEAQGYLVSTTRNVGDARVSGLEFDYRQNLTFLPAWARGFTVFGNLTLQHLEGSQMATFSNFVGRTSNWGVTYSRQRFTVRLAVNLKGLVKQGQVANAGVEPGTFIYLLPRTSADLSAEYRLTRKVAVYVSGRNVNEAVDNTVRYGPNTPRDRIISARVHYGATWYVGLKGSF